MMLNASAGAISTGAGRAPPGARHCEKGSPAAESSSAIRLIEKPPALARLAAVDASRKRCVAPLSMTMPASCSAVDDGASGETTTPARSAPRNSVAYSMEVVAQTAMVARCATPSR